MGPDHAQYYTTSTANKSTYVYVEVTVQQIYETIYSVYSLLHNVKIQ